jgi:hypothetical protein
MDCGCLLEMTRREVLLAIALLSSTPLYKSHPDYYSCCYFDRLWEGILFALLSFCVQVQVVEKSRPYKQWRVQMKISCSMYVPGPVIVLYKR